MDHNVAIIVGFAIPAVLSVIVSAIVAVPLFRVLKDLTGASHRAQLWILVSIVFVVLLPQVFVMFTFPTIADVEQPLLQAIFLCRWGVIGLLLSLAAVSGVLIGFIHSLPPEERRPELYRARRESAA